MQTVSVHSRMLFLAQRDAATCLLTLVLCYRKEASPITFMNHVTGIPTQYGK